MDRFACIKDFKDEAFNILPKDILNFINTGACEGLTLADNKNAFAR